MNKNIKMFLTAIAFISVLAFIMVISDFYTPLVNYVYLLMFGIVIVYFSYKPDNLRKHYYEILSILVLFLLGALVFNSELR